MNPGITLSILLGPKIPAPPEIIRSIESISINSDASGSNGFQITFSSEREKANGFKDYNLINNLLLKPFNRITIILNFGIIPKILMDGFITNHQFQPQDNSASAKLTITGEDVSFMMDRIELPIPHVNEPDYILVNAILAKYAALGIVPVVIPPPFQNAPDIGNTYIQTSTDLRYIRNLASRYHYVFFVEPIDIIGKNMAYFGPLGVDPIPQNPLTFNMGSFSNVDSISFQYDATKPTVTVGTVKDKKTGLILPIVSLPIAPVPLSSIPATIEGPPKLEWFRAYGERNYVDALLSTHTKTQESNRALTASCQVDTIKYGDRIKPRRLIQVRGVGFEHDGLYYIKSVSHDIKLGQYKMSLNLVREGKGSTISKVYMIPS